MPGLFSTPHPPEADLVRLEAREVVVDLFGKPHLLTRLTFTGPYFPHRAQRPYAAVGEVRSRFVRIADDGLRADAYFDRRLPATGPVVLGWGTSVDLVMPQPFRADGIRRLDRERLRQTVPGVVVPDRRGRRDRKATGD